MVSAEKGRATMTQCFDVTDRDTVVHKRYLLEASAGTGKTFSIENVVARLIIEGAGVDLENILVVTFTRAATRELRDRIRTHIETVVSQYMRGWLRGDRDTAMPDYVLAVCEHGEDAITAAIRRLENALFCFDNAHIFTIHSFCYHMLREYAFERSVTEDAWDEDNDKALEMTVHRVIKDFLRTELDAEVYSPAQIDILLRRHAYDSESLCGKIKSVIMQGSEIEGGSDVRKLREIFSERLTEISRKYRLTTEGLLHDFEMIASSYKGICGRDKKPKKECMEEVTLLSKLSAEGDVSYGAFEKLIKTKMACCAKIYPENKKKTAPYDEEALKHPGAFARFYEELVPILSEASAYLALLARVAHDTKKLLDAVLYEQEMITHDDLLKEMEQALECENFVTAVREKYGAVIIDEFQDTDPIQWKIFHTLFYREEETFPLYLVGDPKQSIYGFRNADIYTYLGAAEAVGAEHAATLDTNYRSQQGLVAALNALFSDEILANFMPLPRQQRSLEYPAVKASPYVEAVDFADEKKSVHFFVAEDSRGRSISWPHEKLELESFFPFMAEEILKIKDVEGMGYSSSAVLVRDRYQAERLCRYLKHRNIPVLPYRSFNNEAYKAATALYDMVKAVSAPLSQSDVAKTMGGPLVRATHHEIRRFKEGEREEETLERLYAFRDIITEHGFEAFFYALLESKWIGEDTVRENLVRNKESLTLYNEMHDIVEAVMRKTASKRNIFMVLATLEEICHDEEGIAVGAKPQSDFDAVHVLTLHASKGLEYDVVFALGLAKRDIPRQQLIPVCEEGKVVLKYCDAESEEYKQYRCEIDAEKMRLLYVGMTRAKHRLYMPYAYDTDAKPVQEGCAAPVELFVAQMFSERITQEELYRKIPERGGAFFKERVQGVSEEVSVSLCDSEAEGRGGGVVEEKKTLPEMERPLKVAVPECGIAVTSFSKIAAAGHIAYTNLSPPHDWDNAEKTIHTLPAGAETGEVIHKLFETFPYDKMSRIFSAEDVCEVIAPRLARGKFEAWAMVIAEMMYGAFNMPLQGSDGESFCLKDVPFAKMRCEMEFLTPYRGEEYMKGIVDMFFEYEGKYYLLDWKTHWLGASKEAYSKEMCERCVQEYNYDMQAKIYSQALEKYLDLFEKKPFDEAFGGFFFVFVRGMEAVKVL
jgi:exodeoxyribonuclease V beta subunit